MTTQELKQYIDKVLGNGIRCLLPSYWWKRLFSLTLDKVDEKLDAANIKTINGESVIGEGNLKVGITSVSSMEELNALEAEVGDIATVGYESLSLVSAANLKVAYGSTFLDEWDSLTRIGKVEIGEPYAEEGRVAAITLHGKARFGIKAIIITCENGEFVFSQNSLKKSLDEINEILQNEDYRYLNGSNPDVLDKTYKLYAHSSSAEAYIKVDTWARLLKEGEGGSNITVDSELSAESEKPVQNKAVKAYVDNAVENLTNEIIANEEVHAAALNDLNERLNNGGGGSGGSGVVTFYITVEELSSEYKAKNAVAYASFLALKGECTTILKSLDVPDTIMTMPCLTFGAEERLVLMTFNTDLMDFAGGFTKQTYFALPDGSVTLQQ
jgi:hypothetical protein